MRIPQTPERIKEAPAQALRAVFAGVGQVLLITERIRRRAIGQEHSQAVSTGGHDTRSAPAPAGGNGAHTATLGADQADQVKTGAADTSGTGTNATAAGSAPTNAAKASTAQAQASTAKTGTAKVGPVKAKASSAEVGIARAASAPEETVTPAQPVTSAQTPPPDDPASPEVRGTGVLPVPHYSELSIASLRARLRGLDIAQVRDLLSYERTHEDRANVIAMFERRIARLEEAGGADPAAG